MDQATQAYYMKHLGIPMWIPRDSDIQAEVPVDSAPSSDIASSNLASTGTDETKVAASHAKPANTGPAAPTAAEQQESDDAEFIDPSQLQELAPKKQAEKTSKSSSVSTEPSMAVDSNDILHATWEGLRGCFRSLAAETFPSAVASRGSLKAKIAVFNAEALSTDGVGIQQYNALLGNMLKAMGCNPAACFYSEVLRYPLIDEEAVKAQRAIALRQAALLDVDTAVMVGDFQLADAVCAALGNINILQLPSPQAILAGELSKPAAWQQMAPQLK